MADRVSAAARYSLRGGEAALAAGCAAFGVPLAVMLRAGAAGERAALRLGPDEVLLIGPVGLPPPAVSEGAHSVVDVSERQVGLTLTGREAATALAAGCPLDLDACDVNFCSRTLLGKAEIVLWRTAALSWRVEVWRSFAGYAQALLAQAARDWP